jgi:hypothetical protein
MKRVTADCRRFALRGLGDANEVVTFGFFDGTLDELEASQDDSDYAERREAIAPFVEEVVLNGVHEVAVAWTADAAPAQPRRERPRLTGPARRARSRGRGRARARRRRGRPRASRA